MPNKLITSFHPIEGVLSRRGAAPNPSVELVGSLPIGDAEYEVPSTDVRFVSLAGSDSAAGTEAAPWRTLAKAMSTTPANGTIVIRAGEYHEGGVWWRAQDATAAGNATLGGAILANDGVTIQNYPGEAVWFDGSSVVTGWTFDGTNWRVPFVTKFDRTPTHTRGQDEATWPGGGGSTEGFVVSEFPYAAWPEQVFYDGAQLEQVGNLGDLGPGKFFVEGAAYGGSGVDKNAFISTYYVIRDNPTGHELRISDLSRLCTIGRINTTVRGIGVRRYAPALVDWSSFYVATQPNFFIENCIFEDSATYGLHSRSPSSVMRHLTVRRAGCEGISAGGDGGLIEYSLFQNNVYHRFNYGPDAGDIKLGEVWDYTIRHNRFEDTYGHAVWFDQSCFKNNIYSNDFFRCYGHAIAYEISSRGYIVDNYFEDIGLASDIRAPHLCNPIWLSGSNQCQVWNNTIVNSSQQIKVVQDYRVPTASDSLDRYGRDDSRPAAFYDGSDPNYEYNGVMSWTAGDHEIKNNICYNAAGSGTAIQNTFITVSQDTYRDLRPRRDTVAFNVQTGGNLYNRLSSSVSPRFANGARSTPPSGIEIYATMTGSVYLYPDGTSGPSWKTLTGETGSIFVDNSNAATSTTYPITINPSVAAQVMSQPLDTTTANRTGRTPGETHLGAWR